METRRHFKRDKRKTRITHYNVHLEFRQSIRIINIIYRFYIGIYIRIYIRTVRFKWKTTNEIK